MTAFTFNAANGSTLESYDSKWAGETTIAETQSSVMQVKAGSTYVDIFCRYENAQGDTQQSEVVLKTSFNPTGSDGALLVQNSGGNTGYRVFVDTTDFFIQRNGSYAANASHGLTFSSAGNVVKVTYNHSTGVVKVFANGVEKLSYTDGTPITGGYPGFYFYGDGFTDRTGFVSWTDNVSAASGNPWYYYAQQ